MKLSDFSYLLPKELIADRPAATRSSSRLLSLDTSTGQIDHGVFTDLPDQLGPGDLLVFNDTRVIPARLYARKMTGGRLEILIERIRADGTALVQMRASKAPKAGNRLRLLRDEKESSDAEPVLEVCAREGEFFVVDSVGRSSILSLVEEYGHMPLPPYINRTDDAEDESRYQTVYSRNPGAVAAPTAGLHFDDALLAAIRGKGIGTAFLTLHVGAGSFQPVRMEEIQQHRMHRERVEVSMKVCTAVTQCKANGGRVIAVGTTTVRSLEAAAADGEIQPYSGETDIFIYPGYEFRVIDGMVTNFHLPESTLLMLVSAFGSKDRLLDAYGEAIEKHYRFFSYGDAMFLHRGTGH